MANKPTTSATASKTRLWRGPNEETATPEAQAVLGREFPPGASELELDGVSRRKFVGLMGASAAFAGATMSGCMRKPKERIVPLTERPEDTIPGKPRYFRSAFSVGPRVIGVHVESQDGRPTKIEGNYNHPMSGGATDAWSQASVLGLYDPDRSKEPVRNGNPSSWRGFADFLGGRVESGGAMAFVIDSTPSPSLHRLANRITRQFPGSRFYVHDVMGRNGTDAARAMVGAATHTPFYSLERAKVVFSVDADIFGVDGDSVRNARGFMRGRNVTNELAAKQMNRLYIVEAGITTTGMTADHRFAISSQDCGMALAAVASRLGVALPAEVRGAVGNNTIRDWALTNNAMVAAIASDLTNAGPAGVVMVGERQPAWVHGLAMAVNTALAAGSNAAVMQWAPAGSRINNVGSLADFARDAASGAFSTAFFINTNPLYDAPSDIPIHKAIHGIEATVHVGSRLDETAVGLGTISRIAWHVPSAHWLEAWGDLRAADGSTSIQQPLIAPLWGGIAPVELLSAIAGGVPAIAALGADETRDAGHQAVKSFYTAGRGGVDEAGWRQALHDGVVTRELPSAQPAFNWARVAAAIAASARPDGRRPGELELNFTVDYSVADGRYANNGWLQELPDPVTKLTWDNALLMNFATAQALGVRSGHVPGSEYHGDLVDITLDGRIIRTAVMVLPGVAENVVVLPVGYGRARSVGEVAASAGFDAYRLKTSAGWWARGATVQRVGETYPLATTQEHWSLAPREGYEERSIVKYFDAQDYADGAGHIRDHELHNDHHIAKFKLFGPPDVLKHGQQWAMTFDLAKCTGCGVCVAACVAENNISVVGKERVLNGREMHWIRIDRYFTGTYENPGKPIVQPVACAHCETAPCEQVCPVAATQHSPDGLNDMAYNRCIGTRYCLNNCPYKVRRFNFFNYSKENGEANPLLALQRNPDVTVRFRGVMEKCTYCTQRITEARIRAKVNGNGVIPKFDSRDPKGSYERGAFQTACQQACPAGAIVFGDKNQQDSEIARTKLDPRNYSLLEYLNILPRTTYLAKVRNPNPELVKAGLG